jgi:hypothetical protein
MNYGQESPPPQKQNCEWTATTTHGVDTVQLHVKGVCQEPTPGYTLTLVPAEPQGINPEILLLQLTETPPSGMATQVITPTPVEYTRSYVIPGARVPKQVTILPGGPTLDVN